MIDLTTPLETRHVSLKNRLVMPPMATRSANELGHVTRQTLDYYDRKSRGGYFSLVTTEHSYVSEEGRASRGQLSISDDSDIAGLRRLVSMIHRNGSKAAAQLNHAGGQASTYEADFKTIGPVAVMPDGRRVADFEMDLGDINRLIKGYADAARRAVEAGYDAVEIHSAHGYLLNQFYSPLTNARADAYGGIVPNRIRLHLQIIAAVRDAVGDDYPVMLRLGAVDDMMGGTTIADSVEAVRAFERAGIDIIDISGGVTGYTREGREDEQGYFSEVSEAVRGAVSIPVILTGGIVEREAADRLLADGKADLIGVGRAVLSDSDWARRAIAGL